MKIGKFSRQHDIAESAIRYYIEYGLLVPDKINKQYVFDEACSKRIKLIKRLKSMDFSLEEIRNIFSFLLITETGESEYYRYLINVFHNKKNDLIVRKKDIDRKIININNEIDNIKLKKHNKNEMLGLPLEFMKYICCPNCSGQFSIYNGMIENNMIFSGELNCKCGFTAKIIDGIIVVNNLNKIDYKINLESFKKNYIQNTDKEFIRLMHEAANWILKKIDFTLLSNKVVMKNNTGIGVFIRNVCDRFPENCDYIAVDSNYEFLKHTKTILERREKKPKIMFICSNFKNLPIKNNCVDIIVDKICGSCYDFKKMEFPVKTLKDKLKKNGKWIGNYMYFNYPNYPVNLKKNYIPYFTLENLEKMFDKYYKEVDHKVFEGYNLKIGEYASFVKAGDIINQWLYYGYKK